jgi:hypothetical protein
MKGDIWLPFPWNIIHVGISLFALMFVLRGDNASAILVILYFLPSMVAAMRRHHMLGPVTIVNLFLGWTLVGWVVALAMAAGPVRRAA